MINLKKKLISVVLALTITLMISLPVLAQTWLAYYPTIVIDSSGGDRTAVPVITGIEGQDLIDAGVLSSSGLDSRMRLAGTDIPYMLSTTQVPTYLSSLPALGQAQVDLYISYSDLAIDFDIITGTDGYITITDDDEAAQETLELGSDFEIEQSGYVDTDDATASFRAAGVVSDAANGNITPALPVSWSPNDIWLCLIVSLDNVNSTLPAGWTAIDVGTNNTAAMRTTLYWRRAVAGDAAPLVTHAAGAGISAVIVGYSGVVPYGSPFDVTQDVYVKAPASVVNNFGAGVTTTVNNDTIVLLSGVGGQTTSTGYTGAPTPTERVDAPDIAARPSLVIADFLLVTAGATGARTSTITSFLNNGYQLSLVPCGKNLVYKQDAFRTYIDGATNITSSIYQEGLFPTVVAVSGGNDVINQTDHTINLPAGIEHGDLLLVFMASRGAAVISFPVGWVELFQTHFAANTTLGAWYRVADGTEGATITAITDAARMTAHTSYRIIGHSGMVEAETSATALGVNPDPPDLTPSWGAENTLWFAVCGYDQNRTVTAYPDPPDYTDGRNDFANDAGGCGVGSARQELNVAAENPGTFTISGAADWIANTVAIAPEDLEVTATGIASDDYTVKTYGVANEPAWATGDVLHFTGAADSNVNCGPIHNASAKLWVSFWFRLDNLHNNTSPVTYVFAKYSDGNNFLNVYLDGDGTFVVFLKTLGFDRFKIASVETSWNADQWYHILIAISDTAGIGRLIVDGGTPVLTADVNAVPNGGDFVIGDYDDPGAGSGFIGEIQNVIVGTDDLSEDEEDDLYAGTAPSDADNYWYLDEGAAKVAYDSAGTDNGTIGDNCVWETATYTTGKTGRLCDFYIEVDDGVTDADRWGANLKGASVPGNANDWYLNQNNVMPWMDYYYHTVGGVRHAWYQPNYMVVGTDYDGTASGGTTTTIIDAGLIQADDYWNNALVTITGAGAAAPEGETSIVTDFDDATDTLTVAPAFSDVVQNTDTYTVDFGTLIDRSYYGLDFDGINDRVLVTDDVSLHTTTDFSLELWVKVDDLSAATTPVSYGTYNASGWYIQLQPDGTIRFFEKTNYGAGYLATGIGEITEGVWYYIVVTYDGANFIIYKNENDLITNPKTADMSTPLVNMYFGSYNATGDWLDGLMDEVRIYNRALDLPEIEANYNAGVGSYTPDDTTGLVGWWHMEEGSGATIADSSGEGNTGNITEAIFVNGKVPRPAGNSGTNDSRITWGVNSSITLVYGEPVNYTTTASGLSGEGGYTVAEADMPAEWYGTATNLINLPLYDMFVGINVSTGIPIQTLYVFVIITLCFAFSVAGFLMFNSVMASIIGIGIALGIGSAMTVVPMWIFFTFLILAIGIAYLKGRAVFG